MLQIFHTNNKDFQLMQNAWSQQLNPLIESPLSQNIVLKNVKLTTGTNVINTLLGRKLQGWVITRLRGPANIYDNQDNNTSPALTLILISSADVTIDLMVF